MAERKKGSSAPPPSSTAPASGKSEPASGALPATATESRKPWVKKTPVEVVLEQIGKQEEKVNDMREALKKEERELSKLQQAKKVLEAS